MTVTCEWCHKEINPIAISTFKNSAKTRYHEGCKKKAQALRDRERRKIKKER